MTAPTPYLQLPGTARAALAFWADVFGGEVVVHTLADFARDDGPADAVAHGELRGPVTLFASDAVGDDVPLRTSGLLFSLLGAADATTLGDWFARLSDGGTVVDELQDRPWGDVDGQVIDRFGVHWLIGYHEED